MPRYLLVLAVIICVSAQFSCSSKSVDLINYSDPIIRYGKGGGITGFKSEYILLHDGRIFRQDPVTDSLSYMRRVANRKTKVAFTDFDQLSRTALYAPGELYYYISRKSDKNVTHLIWGDRNVKVDPAITEYWTYLNSFVKTQ